MNSQDVQTHRAADQITAQAKKPWVTPSLQVIPLKNAEGGTHLSTTDGIGAHSNRPKS